MIPPKGRRDYAAIADGLKHVYRRTIHPERGIKPQTRQLFTHSIQSPSPTCSWYNSNTRHCDSLYSKNRHHSRPQGRVWHSRCVRSCADSG